MSRRRFFRGATALVTVSLLAAACGPHEKKDSPMDAEQILAEVGFETPGLEMQVSDGPLEGTVAWSRIVTFTGPEQAVNAWVSENFPSGIESRAYKDDMQIAVAQLGEGVQHKGDRLASGTRGSVAFVVVVGQEGEPTVHVAVRSTSR